MSLEILNSSVTLKKFNCGIYIVNSNIKFLNRHTVLRLMYSNLGRSCCICLEDRLQLYIKEVRLYFTPCSYNHLICHDCIKALINYCWLKMIDIRCPICRSTLLKYENE
jgi:hypothetical protein